MGPTLIWRLLTYAPSPPPAVGTAVLVQAYGIASGTDAEDGGRYQVVGTTKIKGSPDYAVSRKVFLHDQVSGRLVRAQWSQPGTGAYSFQRLRLGTYYVVAFDHTRAYNGVIATDYVSEAMP